MYEYISKPSKQPKKPKYLKASGKVSRSWAAKKKKWFKENPPNHEGYYICGICRGWVHESDVDLDHIINRSLRPDLREDDSNLQPAHRSCNIHKKLDVHKQI